MALCEASLARHEGSKVEKGRVDLSHKMKRKDASGQSLTLSLSCVSVVLLNKKNYYITLLDDGIKLYWDSSDERLYRKN